MRIIFTVHRLSKFSVLSVINNKRATHNFVNGNLKYIIVIDCDQFEFFYNLKDDKMQIEYIIGAAISSKCNEGLSYARTVYLNLLEEFKSSIIKEIHLSDLLIQPLQQQSENVENLEKELETNLFFRDESDARIKFAC
ncbi:hypothetical protein RIR_jg38369.t1 [Rhizophagus irregularis DAOM 181602=DAOM 197198]|nr:hypothetical protein RIR_jg38369.t1 [Rhizophagus irregularis DAOM 181602=DAOM 197198]